MTSMSRISHKYKFIFFAYPKTGSATIRKILDPYSDIIATTYTKRTKENPFYSHITAQETKKIFEQRGWDYNSYFKFVFIRNPYSRLVSLYNMSSKKIRFKIWISRLKNQGNGGCAFSDQKWKVHGAYNLLNFAGDGRNLLVDKVVKLENIDAELPHILKRLGIHTPDKIPKGNIGKYGTKGKNIKNYYDKETRKRVQKLYKWDFKKFGYHF